MRILHLTVSAAFVVTMVSPAAAILLATPGSISGNGSIGGSVDSAVVFLFLNHDAGSVSVHEVDGDYTNHTAAIVDYQFAGAVRGHHSTDTSGEQSHLSVRQASLTSKPGVATWIRIEGQGLRWMWANESFRMAGTLGGEAAARLPEFDPYWANIAKATLPEGVFFASSGDSSSLALSMEHVEHALTYGVQFNCHGPGACPDGGGRWTGPGVEPALAQIGATYSAVSEFALGKGSLELEGHMAGIVIIAPTINADIEGEVHIPHAVGPELANHQSLALGGHTHLLNWRRDDHGMAGDVDGSIQAIRLDETYIDPSTLFGPGAAMAAGGLGLAGLFTAIKFLAPLFTRIPAAKALEHPRRQRLNRYIAANPGATFRELLRGTEIPAGTARHHLTIMRRSGLILERRHHSTLRFYENHGKFEETWAAVAVLREPDMKQLHGWIKQNPGRAQMDILAAMAEEGWMRSTTQHRLKRLESEGLVTATPRGRRKLYKAHDEPQRPRQDDWVGLPAATP